MELRDGGAQAYRTGDYAAAADRLDEALALKPDAILIKRMLAESLLRLGRPEEAFALVDDGARARDDARLHLTWVYAARTLLRDALDRAEPERFRALAEAGAQDLSAGANGAPFRMLTGALAADRAEIQSGLAQMAARARQTARREAQAEAEAEAEAEAPRQEPGETGEARRGAKPRRARIDDAAVVGPLYVETARTARALFEIDAAAGCFLLDVAIAAAPDEPALRAERLRCGLARGEVDNPNAMLDYALDARAYGGDVAELDRLYRATLTLSHPAPAATTRALRALRMRQLEVLASDDATLANIEAAGRVALDFGDFNAARDAMAMLASRAETERHAFRGDTRSGEAETSADARFWAGLPERRDTAIDAARRFTRVLDDASLAAAELVPDFTQAAELFWREVLDAHDPFETFFETLSDEAVAVLAPTGLLTASADDPCDEIWPEGRRSAATRQTAFATARVLARKRVPHQLKLFPWTMRELDRLPRGKPVIAPYARRGPRANMLIAYGPGPLPHTAYVDRLGVEGWSEIARTLPFVEARTSETYAFFEAVRAMLFGRDAPPIDPGLKETVAVLLQSPMDPRLSLARITLQDMLNEVAAWVERRRRRLLIWRPAQCRHLGMDETIARLTKSDRIDWAPTPSGPGALGRAAAETAGVVTINAPAAFEALIALRPVVLGGVADYHHGGRLLEGAQELSDALDRIDAPVDPNAVARFAYDYLTGPLANLTSPLDVERKIVDALAGVGLLESDAKPM